ncbi:MAG: hypothetical protein JW910_10025, partial [Anaerolineae bacterium]|nr:hypothetical protein [Anaerolineae bacterium]
QEDHADADQKDRPADLSPLIVVRFSFFHGPVPPPKTLNRRQRGARRDSEQEDSDFRLIRSSIVYARIMNRFLYARRCVMIGGKMGRIDAL